MGRDDWYRNTIWNDAIEAEFRERLRRARDKSQYLSIQAYYLAPSFPTVALTLLEQFFALGASSDEAQAHCDKARALTALGDTTGATQAYETALKREQTKPSVMTHAYLDFPRLVVEQRIIPLYPRALEVLETNAGRPLFPVERYWINGLSALLLQHLGREADARNAAALAMVAARETDSGFRYHRLLGLVTDVDNALSDRIASLAKKHR